MEAAVITCSSIDRDSARVPIARRLELGQSIIDLCHLLIGEIKHLAVLNDSGGRGSTWNWDNRWHSRAFRDSTNPVDRELSGCATLLLSHSLDLLNELQVDGKVLRLETRVVPHHGVFGQIFKFAKLACKHAAADGGVGDHRDAVLGTSCCYAVFEDFG